MYIEKIKYYYCYPLMTSCYFYKHFTNILVTFYFYYIFLYHFVLLKKAFYYGEI